VFRVLVSYLWLRRRLQSGGEAVRNGRYKETLVRLEVIELTSVLPKIKAKLAFERSSTAGGVSSLW
jgi:hypothetical protein